jgi:NAD(P)-dependent dehydrogenase (short-subunit alcohol dehydrogenase family)
MMNRVRDKVAMVTGGAGGIGTAVARKLVEEGAKVVIADIKVDAARRLAEEIGGSASAIGIDAEDVKSIAKAIATTVERHGRIDVLHNNAAATDMATIIADKGPADIEFDDFDHIMRVNLRGYLAGCKYAIPYMLKSGGGVIINTTSAMSFAGLENYTAYSCSKAAINQLTRQVATMYGKQGIRCNAIAPFVILTEAAKAAVPPDMQKIYLRQALTPHLGEPQDIANLACFLASDESRFITGQIINCDGGVLAHYPDVADTRDWMAKMSAQKAG